MSQTQFQNTAIKRDHDTLQTHTTVTVDAPNRLIVHNFAYPEGWTPQTAALLIRYPRDYPHTQPAIYIPRDLSHDGRVTHFMGAPDHLEDQWIRWCTHYIDWQQWRAAARRIDTPPILRFLGLIRESLNHPDKANPLNNAD